MRRAVIYAWNYSNWGGVQIYFFSLIKEVRRHYRVIAVIPEDSDPLIINALQDLGVEIELTQHSPDITIRRRFIDGLKVRYRFMTSENMMVNTILRLCSGQDTIVQPDIGFWQSALPIYRLTRGTNVVITQHTPLKKQWFLRDWIWRIKGRFVAGLPRLWFMSENDDAKKSLVPYLGTRKASEVLLTYAGYDPIEIDSVISQFPGRNLIREKYALPDDPILATIGQFIERKGCWTLLDALKNLVDADVGFTFVWLSTANVPDEVAERISRYGLGDRFRIMSAKEMGDMRLDPLTLLLAADVFVLASLEEGLPIALIEAMALGRACLTTNVNAIPEAIQDGFSGVLIEPNDSEALASELAGLIGDPARREMLGSNAKIVAAERFNEKTTAELSLKLYDEVWKSCV